jgi:hypothetical protein
MFLALPAMLRSGVDFWAALAIACAMTFSLYLAAIWVASFFGVKL